MKTEKALPNMFQQAGQVNVGQQHVNVGEVEGK